MAPAPAAPLASKHFADRKAWRTWLKKNHATSPGVWLVSFKKSTGRTTLSYDEAVEEALCFGWIDSLVRRIDEARHAQRFSPRTDPTKWSPSNLARMNRLVAEGRVAPAGLAAFRPGRPRPPRPKPSAEAPKDLATALDESPAARRFWDALAPGYRRNYVGWIENAKRPETRRRRIQAAVFQLGHGAKNPFMEPARDRGDAGPATSSASGARSTPRRRAG